MSQVSIILTSPINNSLNYSYYFDVRSNWSSHPSLFFYQTHTPGILYYLTLNRTSFNLYFYNSRLTKARELKRRENFAVVINSASIFFYIFFFFFNNARVIIDFISKLFLTAWIYNLEFITNLVLSIELVNLFKRGDVEITSQQFWKVISSSLLTILIRYTRKNMSTQDLVH